MGLKNKAILKIKLIVRLPWSKITFFFFLVGNTLAFNYTL